MRNILTNIRASQGTVAAEMLLSYNPTTSLNLAIETASGDDWEIDWGDGIWEQYASSNSTYRTKTFGGATAGVAKVRSATGKELSDLHIVRSNDGTWSFDVADLSAAYLAFFQGNSMAITGDVGDIKATYAAYFEGDSMALTGDVGTIKATFQVFFIGDSMELTYTTRTWTNIPTHTFYLSLATGHLTTSELSQMLIDMDASGITGTATLDFRYNNGAPNAAGETAADNLRAKGYNVLTNASVPTYDTDFQAWIDYCISQGYYMTSDTVKLDAANQYVLDSKADGTWYGKDVFHLFAWNDLQMDDASLVCLKRLIKVDVYGGMVYTVNGWQGNNVDGYIDTKFNPSVDGVNFTLNNAGRGVLEFSDDSKNKTDSYYFGISAIIDVNTMMNRYTNKQRLNSNNNAVSPNPTIAGIGLKTNYRDNSTDVRFYYIQNEYLGTQTSSSVNYSNNITLFRSGGAYSDCGSGILLFGKSFTQTENESIRTNLNTYLTEIGLTPYA